MYSLFGLLNDNTGSHCVAILLAKMLIWAPFSQLMCTFFSLLTPVKKKSFSFVCRINSFQNQNTHECNFNLIINNSHLFNGNISGKKLLKKVRVEHF